MHKERQRTLQKPVHHGMDSYPPPQQLDFFFFMQQLELGRIRREREHRVVAECSQQPPLQAQAEELPEQNKQCAASSAPNPSYQSLPTPTPPPPEGGWIPTEGSSSESGHSFFRNETHLGFVKQVLLGCEERSHLSEQQQFGTFVPCILGEERQMNNRCGRENHSRASASGKIPPYWRAFPERLNLGAVFAAVSLLLFAMRSDCYASACVSWHLEK